MFGHYLCDGDNDCGDNSDEIGCGMFNMVYDITHTKTSGSPAPCHSSAFTCDNGNCVPGHYRCEGYDDCGDNSDEIGCGMFNMMYDIIHTNTSWFSSNLSFLCIYV